MNPLAMDRGALTGESYRLYPGSHLVPSLPIGFNPLQKQDVAHKPADAYAGLYKPLLVPVTGSDRRDLDLNGSGSFLRLPWVAPYTDPAVYPAAYKASFLSPPSPYSPQHMAYQSLFGAAGDERLFYFPHYASLGVPITIPTTQESHSEKQHGGSSTIHPSLPTNALATSSATGSRDISATGQPPAVSDPPPSIPASTHLYRGTEPSSTSRPFNTGGNTTKEAVSDRCSAEKSTLPANTLAGPQKPAKHRRENTFLDASAKDFEGFSHGLKLKALPKSGFVSAPGYGLTSGQDLDLKESLPKDVTAASDRPDMLSSAPSSWVVPALSSQNMKNKMVDSVPDITDDSQPHSSSAAEVSIDPVRVSAIERSTKPRVLQKDLEKVHPDSEAESPAAPETPSLVESVNSSAHIYGDSYLPLGYGYANRYIPYSLADSLSYQRTAIPSFLCNSFYPQCIAPPTHSLPYGGHPNRGEFVTYPNSRGNSFEQAHDQLQAKNPASRVNSDGDENSDTETDKFTNRSIAAPGPSGHLSASRDDVVCIDLLSDDTDNDSSTNRQRAPTTTRDHSLSQGSAGCDDIRDREPQPSKASPRRHTQTALPHIPQTQPPKHNSSSCPSPGSSEISEKTRETESNSSLSDQRAEEKTMRCARTSPRQFSRKRKTEAVGAAGNLGSGFSSGVDNGQHCSKETKSGEPANTLTPEQTHTRNNTSMGPSSKDSLSTGGNNSSNITGAVCLITSPGKGGTGLSDCPVSSSKGCLEVLSFNPTSSACISPEVNRHFVGPCCRNRSLKSPTFTSPTHVNTDGSVAPLGIKSVNPRSTNSDNQKAICPISKDINPTSAPVPGKHCLPFPNSVKTFCKSQTLGNNNSGCVINRTPVPSQHGNFSPLRETSRQLSPGNPIKGFNLKLKGPAIQSAVNKDQQRENLPSNATVNSCGNVNEDITESLDSRAGNSDCCRKNQGFTKHNASSRGTRGGHFKCLSKELHQADRSKFSTESQRIETFHQSSFRTHTLQRDRQETDRQQADRQQKDRQERVRQERVRQEKDRQERERQEKDRQERERQERERQEKERQEADRQERERQEKDRQEKDRQERERQERDRQERERQERDKQQTDRQQTDRQERDTLTTHTLKRDRPESDATREDCKKTKITHDSPADDVQKLNVCIELNGLSLNRPRPPGEIDESQRSVCVMSQVKASCCEPTTFTRTDNSTVSRLQPFDRHLDDDHDDIIKPNGKRPFKTKHQECVSYCLEQSVCGVNHQDTAGFTALHDASARGYVSIVRRLLQHGADVNCSAHDGTRPLHDAVENDHVEVVRYLLACGANPTHTTLCGRGPISMAHSAAMETFLEDYLSDLEGRSEKDPGICWEFYSSSVFEHCSDEGLHNILRDAPGPEEEEEDEDDKDVFQFELSDRPLLPCYNIQVPLDRCRNWLLLCDVIGRLRMTSRSFRRLFPQLNIRSVPQGEFYRQARLSPLLTGPDQSLIAGFRTNATDPLELVELTPELCGMLGSSVELVGSRWDAPEHSPPPVKPPILPVKLPQKTTTEEERATANHVTLTPKQSHGPTHRAFPPPADRTQNKMDASVWGAKKFGNKTPEVLVPAKANVTVTASMWKPQKSRSQNKGTVNTADPDYKPAYHMLVKQKQQKQNMLNANVTKPDAKMDVSMWEKQQQQQTHENKSARIPRGKTIAAVGVCTADRQRLPGSRSVLNSDAKETDAAPLNQQQTEIKSKNNPSATVEANTGKLQNQGLETGCVFSDPNATLGANVSERQTVNIGDAAPLRQQQVGIKSKAVKRAGAASSEGDVYFRDGRGGKTTKMAADWQRSLGNVRVHIRDVGHSHTERQTDRQMDRQTDRQMDRQTDRHIDGQTDRRRERDTGSKARVTTRSGLDRGSAKIRK